MPENMWPSNYTSHDFCCFYAFLRTSPTCILSIYRCIVCHFFFHLSVRLRVGVQLQKCHAIWEVQWSSVSHIFTLSFASKRLQPITKCSSVFVVLIDENKSALSAPNYKPQSLSILNPALSVFLRSHPTCFTHQNKVSGLIKLNDVCAELQH